MVNKFSHAVPTKPDAAQLPGGAARPAGAFYSNSAPTNAEAAPGTPDTPYRSRARHFQPIPSQEQLDREDREMNEDLERQMRRARAVAIAARTAELISLIVVGYAILVFGGVMQ